MLREAGYRQREDTKRLTLLDDENGVEFFYLRPRDIALYVGEGTLDVGITGRDLLHDSGAKAEEALQLGFGRSRFRFAGPAGRFTSLEDLAGKRIATSYVGVVEAFLQRAGIDATVTRLDGAVESSIQLGVADVVADVVETGSTLRQAGLEVFGETILESEAVVITRGGGQMPAAFETFRRRVEGVLVARSYVMMDYDIRAQDVPAATELAPGLEGPTVSPLHREGWVAVRVMVPREGAQRLMDDLWSIGARAILLTDIHACRL
jgi:ATP phosphoribosyltransferase